MKFILGPCQLEENSFETAMAIQEAVDWVEQKVGKKVYWMFKGSFDKANRTSYNAERGIGIARALTIFDRVQSRLNVPCITDAHNVEQIEMLGQHTTLEAIQIPAFLCRQTDLIEAAAENFVNVNIKKGQFLAPSDVQYIVEKYARASRPFESHLMLTERGTTFGYNNLVVDMRAFREIRESFERSLESGDEDYNFDMDIVFDATHSAQKPGGGSSSGGNRLDVPQLAYAATATGNVDIIFSEVHPDPDNAPSDGPNSLKVHDVTFREYLLKIMEIHECVA